MVQMAEERYCLLLLASVVEEQVKSLQTACRVCLFKGILAGTFAWNILQVACSQVAKNAVEAVALMVVLCIVVACVGRLVCCVLCSCLER